jgi:sec-independent protein translocase protein TatA
MSWPRRWPRIAGRARVTPRLRERYAEGQRPHTRQKEPSVNLGPTELIILLVIVMLIFGANRLPKLARSLGESAKEFKKGVDNTQAARDSDEPKDS